MSSIKRIGLALIALFLGLVLMACQTEENEQKEDLVQMNYDAPKTSHFDREGNLLVTYDIAYKDLFDRGLVKYEDTHILIKVKTDFDLNVTKSLDQAGIEAFTITSVHNNYQWLKASIKTGFTAKEVIQKLRPMKDILIADYDYIYESEALDYTPVLSNEHIASQWYLDRYGIEEAWVWLSQNGHNPGGDTSVVVAVIDTGVDYLHHDLDGNMWTNPGEIQNNGIDDDNNGYVDDYYGINTTTTEPSKKSNPMDDHGHGTHVAGIIAAENNLTGIVGIAYNTKIMAVKAGQASGHFNQSAIAEAILYASAMGADIINMSFGGQAISIAVQDALMTAYTRSVLVASAGNDNLPNEPINIYKVSPNYPAGLSYVIGVMSVDEDNRESAFSNWDVKEYNQIEYEIYAPGENILSTIPNNRYASWSGTSMAAPIVSGIAALVRSIYPDRNMYPNKFIMGQVISTTDTAVYCGGHLEHNIPYVIDAYKALTVKPKPSVTLYDYYIFDGKDISPQNNGDGYIDAGETIDIGVVLRNRWGMSKDTIITLDATSDFGVSDPYITFLTNNIDFGGVGTYSIKDTLIRQNNVITGVDNPVRVKIASDTPNDYLIKLHVTGTYKNALDDTDLNHYNVLTKNNTIELKVRSGVILPNIIDEDTTLTKDNYYIIPNSMLITEGTTVTVEAGTQIQFWSGDPEDPYAEKAITYLKVDGRLIVNGSEAEPVKMFPSELMFNYVVKIFEGEHGYVSFDYVVITNPILDITYANHTKFIQSITDYTYNRSLYNSQVSTSWAMPNIVIDYVENSIFYAIGGKNENSKAYIQGEFYQTIFAENAIEISSYSSCDLCVFLNNNNIRHGGVSGSSMTLSHLYDFKSIQAIKYDPVTDTYYLKVTFSQLYNNSFLKPYITFAEYLNGSLAMFETFEEYQMVKDMGELDGYIGIIRNPIDGSYSWVNGEPLPEFITFESAPEANYYLGYMDNQYKFSFPYSSTAFIYEIKGLGYIEDMMVPEDEITMDLSGTYWIEPETLRGTHDLSTLKYHSSDTSILTVEEGIITPVGLGMAYVYVSAPDYGAYTIIKVNVVEKVDIEAFNIALPTTIHVGEKVYIDISTTPTNTTENNFIFTSSNESVLTISPMGLMTGVSHGQSIITVKHPDLTTQFTIQMEVVTAIESIAFESPVYRTTLDDNLDDIGFIYHPIEGNLGDIIWETSNADVAYVNENGKLVKVGIGSTVIRATNTHNNKYVERIVTVSNTITNHQVKKLIYNWDRIYTLNEDGKLYVWGKDILVPTEVLLPDTTLKIIDFTLFSNKLIVVFENGTVKAYDTGYFFSRTEPTVEEITLHQIHTLTNVKKVVNTSYALLFLKHDGSVWGVGDNTYGEIGDGTKNPRYTPTQSMVNNVKDIASKYSAALFLTQDNKAYITGTEERIYDPKWIKDNVVSITGDGYSDPFNVITATKIYFYSSSSSPYSEEDVLSNYHIMSSSSAFYTLNGDVYGYGFNRYGQLGLETADYIRDYTKIPNLSNIEKIYPYQNNTFFVSTTGELFATGNNDYYQLANYTKQTSFKAIKVYFALDEDDVPISIIDDNLDDAKLFENRIILTFNNAVSLLYGAPYIQFKDSSGNAVSTRKYTYLNQLIIEPFGSLVDEETYTLTLPAYSVGSIFGKSISNTTYIFKYYHGATHIDLASVNIEDGQSILQGEHTFEFTYTYAKVGDMFGSITLKDINQNLIPIDVSLTNNKLSIHTNLSIGTYYLWIPEASLKDNIGGTNPGVDIAFIVFADLVWTSNSHDDPNKRYDTNESIFIEYPSAVQSTNLFSIRLYKGETVINPIIVVVDNVLIISPTTPLLSGETYRLVVPYDAIKDNNNIPNQAFTTTFTTYSPLMYITHSFLNEAVFLQETLKVYFNHVEPSINYEGIVIKDNEGVTTSVVKSIHQGVLSVKPTTPLNPNKDYRLYIPSEALKDSKGLQNDLISLPFHTIDRIPRDVINYDYLVRQWENFYKSGQGGNISNSAILNNILNPETTTWLRFIGGTAYDYDYLLNVAPLGNNYWGTTDKTLINRQILDFDDFQSLVNIMEGEVLTKAPENTFPFVSSVVIKNAFGEVIDTAGNEPIQVEITFNRDMQTDIPLRVRFGSSLPYAEYEIPGSYINSRTWVGNYTLTTVIENGNQLLNIMNGHAQDLPWFVLMDDVGRFGFEIDTTAAQALILQGIATPTGIQLIWEQDDFDTLAGYNIYRSNYEDGYYQRINTTVIPSDTKTFFDDSVYPGSVYYYNFTVVKTDLTESIPSGKLIIRALDTMSPDLIHTRIIEAYNNQNLVITALVNDNVSVSSVRVYYRTIGETTYQYSEMIPYNNKYTGIIYSNAVTLAGLEYYVVASDGINQTFKGSPEQPFVINIKVAVDPKSYGDVNGDGIISSLDALMILQAINDKLNLTQEQFLRADIDKDGVLEASEALKILQYVSGKIKSIQ